MEIETPQAGANNADEQDSAAQDSSEVAKLRQEAASWRTKFRAAEGKLKEAEPVLTAYQQQQEAQKTEAQKAAEQRDAARAEAEQAKADAALARKEAAVLRLATKAGVDPDLVPFLDLSKLDLEDEKGALEILGKLATARQSGGASNPARGGAAGASDDELRKIYFGGGGSRPTIFGGN